MCSLSFCGYVYVWMCVYVCGGRELILCVFSSQSSHYLLRRGSLPEFGVYWLAKVTGLGFASLPSHWGHTCKQPQLTFNCGVRGSELKSVCFCSKHFTSWAISTVPVVLILTQGFFPCHLEKSLLLGLWWGRASWHKTWRVESSGSPQSKQEAERHERARDPIFPSKCDLFLSNKALCHEALPLNITVGGQHSSPWTSGVCSRTQC